MSPHILICLAAVLFAGMVQVKASDYNDCHAQQSFATILGDDSLISDECKEYLANQNAPAAGGAGVPDLSSMFAKKKK